MAPLSAEFAGLTYSEIRPDGAVRVLLVDDDGVSSELVTVGQNEAFGVVAGPTWSPDGSTLAFGVGPVAYMTWVVGADGSDPRRLPLTGTTGGSFVAWSPDSRSILVREALDVQTAGWTPRHWIVDVATEEVREVDLPVVSEWLADGSFLGVRGDATWSQGSIVVVSPDGQETALPLVGDTPRLSPAGDRIAFTRWSPTTPSEPAVVVANRDGSDERVIGPGSWPACRVTAASSPTSNRLRREVAESALPWPPRAEKGSACSTSHCRLRGRQMDRWWRPSTPPGAL